MSPPTPPPLPEGPIPTMVTVEDASPSPPARGVNPNPPLPDEELPSTTEGTGRQTTEDGHGEDEGEEGESGGEQAEEDEEEWDPSAETSIKTTRKAVEERPTAAQIQTTAPATATDSTHGWQAVWAPAQNAYYFWNAQTGVTTWENPLVPSSTDTSDSTTANETPTNPPLPPSSELPPTSSWGEAYATPLTSSSYNYTSQPPLPPNALASSSTSTFPSQLPGIDPDLALLLPGARAASLTTSHSTLDAPYVSAAFNSRTGRFTPATYQYTVDHLAEANRAKRQEGAFFDVDGWEKGREEEWKERKRKEMEDGGEEGGKRKVSKKDMERFKEKAREKKARNNAWLKS